MRLVIDLQGAQSGSRNRGIGRYSMALAEAMARQSGTHDVWIALNAGLADSIESIRSTFDLLVPRRKIVTWETLRPTAESDPANTWRQRTGEILREAFLESLRPDIVHVSSLFEGLDDETVTSVGALSTRQTSAVTLYDLIPYIHQKDYLGSETLRNWYQRKLISLRRASLYLAISESARCEGIDYLHLPADKSVNISSAADTRFRPITLSDDKITELRHHYGLKREIVMYTGGADHRKNIDGLIGAYAKLSPSVREKHQLAIVCSVPNNIIKILRSRFHQLGLQQNEVVFTGFVPDDDLVAFYNICTAFCFPSTHEGFGLPVLEAMQCGAAVIGSNNTSIPEVIGRTDALFDPFNETAIAEKLNKVLMDNEFRKRLKDHGIRQSKNFSWEESARRAWSALENSIEDRKQTQSKVIHSLNHRSRLAYVCLSRSAGIDQIYINILSELTRYYDIEIITDCASMTGFRHSTAFTVRDLDWFLRNGRVFDRVLYQLEDLNRIDTTMDVMKKYPGVAVTCIALQSCEFAPSYVYQSELNSINEYNYNIKNNINRYGNYDIIQSLLSSGLVVGIISFSDSLCANSSKQRSANFFGLVTLPAPRSVQPLNVIERNHLRELLSLEENEIVVCFPGETNETHKIKEVLRAWLQSQALAPFKARLVVHQKSLLHGLTSDITNLFPAQTTYCNVVFEDKEESFNRYMKVSDFNILLSDCLTRNIKALLDLMSSGIPFIVDANISVENIPDDCILKIKSGYDHNDLASGITSLSAPLLRRQYGKRSAAYIKENYNPHVIADACREAIDFFTESSIENNKRDTYKALSFLTQDIQSEQIYVDLAKVINRNFHEVVSVDL